MDQQTGLTTDVSLTSDGHAQQRSPLEDILVFLAAGDLWIADRDFRTKKHARDNRIGLAGTNLFR